MYQSTHQPWQLSLASDVPTMPAKALRAALTATFYRPTALGTPKDQAFLMHCLALALALALALNQIY